MGKVPDYLEFFGLEDHPFRLTPDTKYFFPSEPHQRVFEVLRYGLNRGEGFLVLTGEPGAGKTLLLRLLLNEEDPSRELALLFSPTLKPEELLVAILEDLGIELSGKENKEYLLRLFYDHLLKLAQEGKTLLLVIDEAQNLPLESLEELRLLSNFETEQKKLIQILLTGQPSLDEKLRSPALAQLLQRITIWERLEPLSLEETLNYIQFRWHRAGGANLWLDKGALRLLYKVSKGLPRQINKIMDRAVLFAAAEGKESLSKKVIREAIESHHLFPQKNWWFPWAFAMAAMLLIVVFWYWK